METADVLTLLREAAEEAVMPRFRALEDAEVMEKKPGDLVTVADREAEVILTRRLRDAFPGCVVVGEEATAATPALLEALPGPHVFVVDPVDGTRNFVAGSADFAVMAAELRSGVVTRCWIFQPVHQAAYVAERGAGAYVVREGQSTRLPRLEPVDPARPDLESWRVRSSRLRSEERQGDVIVHPTDGSCGIDYPTLVRGEWEAIRYGRGLPWDHAPGTLLLDEVGGLLRTLDGAPYRPAERPRHGLLAARSEAVWDAVRATIA